MSERAEHTFVETSSGKMPPHIAELLRDILMDRRQGADESEAIHDQSAIEIGESNFEQIPAEQQGFVEKNLQLLRATQGHAGQSLREAIRGGVTPEAKWFQEIYEWSVRAAHEKVVFFEEPATNDSPDILKAIATEPELVYERLSFLEKYPETDRDTYDQAVAEKTAKALGVSGDQPKWMDMVEHAFDGRREGSAIESLVREVGFVPTELLTKKKFKSVGGNRVGLAIEALKSLEDSDVGNAARHERAKLLNHLFISKNATSLRRKGERNVTLDANGLFINLKGFHAHLPFGLTDQQTVEVIREDNWMNPYEATELALRRASENFYMAEARSLVDQQVIETAQAFDERVSTVEEAEKELDTLYIGAQGLAKKLIEKGIPYPDRLLEPHFPYRYGRHTYPFILIRIAEDVSAQIADEQEDHTYPYRSVPADVSRTRQTYESRSRVLHTPAYYNVTKVLRRVFEQNLTADPADGFLVFRGQYKKSREGDQQSFLAMTYFDRLHRVLFNEEKHIGPKGRRRLREIPILDRQKYEALEVTMSAFTSFKYNTANMKETERRMSDWGRDPDNYNSYRPMIENCLHFLLVNTTARYQEAMDIYEPTRLGTVTGYDLVRLIHIFQDAEREYRNFLYQNIGTARDFSEKFSPEIQSREVSFGDDFVGGARGRVARDGMDPQLSTEAPPVRVVTLDYKINDPTQTVPFHIEESCLDALRVDRSRPLVNVIGGCRETPGGPKDPIGELSGAVMRVAHKFRTNICVPGTQSGIGTAFGRQNAEYCARLASLPMRDKAHMFAISPAGNTYFPGNRYLEKGNVEQNFAMTPVDSIMTPTVAGWGAAGLEKLHTPYRTHVAYMESLYRRISLEQSRVVVLGSGGLYSVMEINESLNNGFDLILVNDSGRFAEAAAALVRARRQDPDFSFKNPEEIFHVLRQSLEPGVLDEFLRREFGENIDPANDDQRVYRQFFVRFLELAEAHREHIFTTSLKDLETNLDRYLTEKTQEKQNEK